MSADWERRLYLAAHPFAYPLLRGLARLGPVVRVPGVGVVVNDAARAREVLMDGETFRKDGPGSPGDLWTPVLGPSVLLNMEGEAHRALRRRLAELFTPSYTEALCARVLDEPLARVADRLARGAVVDLVDAVRVMAGAVISEVIGLETRSEDDWRRLFEQGEQIVSMVSLRTRRFSASQVERARAVLGPLGDIAAKAYASGDETTVMGRMRALGLSEGEARGAAGAFFLTGTETVATLVPRLIALLHDAGRLDDAVLAPGALDRVIDEAMRVTTPTPVMLRSVHRRAEIAGVRVGAGDRIVIATHNCCRAYGPFLGGGTTPHTPRKGRTARLPPLRWRSAPGTGPFDPDPHPHPPELRRLWFGAGPHFCIGYPLAMAETRAMTRTVLAATPLKVVHRSAARRVLIPGYARLVVRKA